MALIIPKQQRGGQPNAGTVDQAVKTTKPVLSRCDPAIRCTRIIGVVIQHVNAISSCDGGIQACSPEHLRLAQAKAEAMTLMKGTLGDRAADPSRRAADQQSAWCGHHSRSPHQKCGLSRKEVPHLSFIGRHGSATP